MLMVGIWHCPYDKLNLRNSISLNDTNTIFKIYWPGGLKILESTGTSSQIDANYTKFFMNYDLLYLQISGRLVLS